MEVFVSKSGWVEIHDPQNNETHLQSFYNLKKVIKGKGFIVIELNSGMVEAYNQHLELLGKQKFSNIQRIKANHTIEITVKDRDPYTFNKYFNPINALKAE